MAKKILLLGSGELGKEFVISAKRKGQYVVACDSYAGAPAMQVADEFEVFSMLDGDALEAAVAKHKPDIIVPEIEAIRTEKLYNFEEQGIQVVPSAKAVNYTMNRQAIRDLAAKELGLKTAKYFYAKSLEELKEAAEKVGFPCVVKPLMSSSGKGQSVVKSADDLEQAWVYGCEGSRGDIKELIIEEFIKFDSEITLLTVTQKNTNVSLCGAFKNGSTYYISAVPAVLAGGLKVILNDEVVSMSVNAPVNLARSGIINLGDLSLDPSQSQKPDAPGPGQDDAVPSEWGIPGEHNGWSTVDPTPMYEVGSNFVAFDVPAEAAAGFKFKNGETWIGTTSSVALDTWVPAQGEGGQNIMFTAAQGATYDIYFANTLSAFYITLSGSPAPAPLPKPTTGITVAGTFNSWSTTANPAVEEGGYYTLKGIKAAMVNAADATGGDKGFKFVLTEANGTQTWFGAGSASVALSQWYSANRDGGAPNIFVSGDAEADYDVYLTKDMSKFCVVPAGGQIPEDGGAVEPENPGTGDGQDGTYRFVVKVNKSIDWYDKYLYTWENGSPTLGNWPGIKMNWDKEDGNYYVYYYDFPGSWSGRTINYIINNGNGGSGNQTQDLSVTLTGTRMEVTIETSHLN